MKQVKLDKKQLKELTNVLKEIKDLSGKYYKEYYKHQPDKFQILLSITDNNDLSLLHYGVHKIAFGVKTSYRFRYGELNNRYYSIAFDTLFDFIKNSDELSITINENSDKKYEIILDNRIVNVNIPSDIIEIKDELTPSECIFVDKQFIDNIDLYCKITKMLELPINRPGLVNVRLVNENNFNYYYCTETHMMVEQKVPCSVLQTPFSPINIYPIFIKSLLKLKQSVNKINIYKENTKIEHFEDQTDLKYEIISNNMSILVGDVYNIYPDCKVVFPTDTKKVVINTKHLVDFIEQFSKNKKLLYEKGELVKFRIVIKDDEIKFINVHDDENKQTITATHKVISNTDNIEYDNKFCIDFYEVFVDYLDNAVTELLIPNGLSKPLQLVNGDKRILIMPVVTEY